MVTGVEWYIVGGYSDAHRPSMPWVTWEAITGVDRIHCGGLLCHTLADRALVYWGWGGRHCAEGCMALRQSAAESKQSPSGNRAAAHCLQALQPRGAPWAVTELPHVSCGSILHLESSFTRDCWDMCKTRLGIELSAYRPHQGNLERRLIYWGLLRDR